MNPPTHIATTETVVMKSWSFSLDETEYVCPRQLRRAPATSIPGPARQFVPTLEKILFLSRTRRNALTTGTRRIWEYCSSCRENQNSMRRGTQKTASVKATTSAAETLLALLHRETSEEVPGSRSRV